MNPEYKGIVLVFENCDCVAIFPEDIEGFIVDNISYNLWSNGIQYSSWKQCEYFQLSLRNHALENKTSLENKGLGEDNSFCCHLKDYHDIANIEIIALDDSKEDISVPWCEDNEYTNSLEKVEFEEDYFRITINGNNKGVI
jgi:hypothetical protein